MDPLLFTLILCLIGLFAVYFGGEDDHLTPT